MPGASGSRRGVANLPLHAGRAPAWLFRRMVEMAGAITCVITREFGPHEMLRRLSDPFWFQAFGCVLGFDWHSSGVTTTVCGALKESQKRFGADMGIIVCGGKGGTSRQTPREIAEVCGRSGDDGDRLIYASRMSAKVDSAAVQDGYQLYHHAFFFVPGGVGEQTTEGRGPDCLRASSEKAAVTSGSPPVPLRPAPSWCVVQQGMNDASAYARRYHWASDSVKSFVSDPHAAVASESRGVTLNLVAGEGSSNRKAAAELSRLKPEKLVREIRPLLATKRMPLFERHLQSDEFAAASQAVGPQLNFPTRHTITPEDLNPSQLIKVLEQTYEHQPPHFEALLGQPGVGPKTLRSLALIAEVIYNASVSRRDPAIYSFAHGGKDGHPYPVARKQYDENIERLKEALDDAKLDRSEKLDGCRRLSQWLAHVERNYQTLP